MCHKSCVDRGTAHIDGQMKKPLYWATMVDMGGSTGHRVRSPMRSFPYDILKSNQISSENICKRSDMHLEIVAGSYAG